MQDFVEERLFADDDCPMLVLDDTGRVVSSNSRAQEILGLSAEELLRKQCTRDPLSSENALESTKSISRPLFVLSGGENQEIVVSASPMKLEVDQVGRLTLLVLDRSCSSPNAIRLNNDVVVDIAHAIRTPFCTILGYLDLLCEESRTMRKHELGKIARLMRRNALWIEHLVDNLVSGLNICTDHFEVDPVPTRLAGLLEEAAAMVEMLTAGRQRSLTLVLPDAKATLNCDREQVLQMLVNTLSNAVKSTSSGGHVTVTASQVAPFWRISIADDNPGIPWWERPYSRITNPVLPHLTGDPSDTNLGIAIAKAVVELHGGTIGFTCSAEQGNTFWFTLPDAQATLLSPVREEEIGGVDVAAVVDSVPVAVLENDSSHLKSL